MATTFYMMVGAPGSGKSTYLSELKATQPQLEVVSPDELREQFSNPPGNRADQTQNAKVWDTATKMVISRLKAGIDTALDATMVKARDRRRFLKQIEDIPHVYKKALVFNTALPTLLRRNSERKWKVPDEVVERMYNSFSMPTTEEGFNSVWNL